MSDDLKRLRDAIDRVDDGILEALNQRAKLAREIGTL
jgi:chorismate mutase